MEKEQDQMTFSLNSPEDGVSHKDRTVSVRTGFDYSLKNQ